MDEGHVQVKPLEVRGEVPCQRMAGRQLEINVDHVAERTEVERQPTPLVFGHAKRRRLLVHAPGYLSYPALFGSRRQPAAERGAGPSISRNRSSSLCPRLL